MFEDVYPGTHIFFLIFCKVPVTLDLSQTFIFKLQIGYT